MKIKSNSGRTFLSDSDKIQLVVRYRAGEGSRRLSKEYHVCPERVKSIIRSSGVELRQNDHNEETKLRVIELHQKSNKLAKDIYKECGISESTYTQWTRGVKRENPPKRINPMLGTNLMELWTKRHGEKIAEEKRREFKRKASINNRGENNNMFGRPSPGGSGNGWKGWYEEKYFRSLRELTFMLESKQNNIVYETGEKIIIPYLFNNTSRTYRPDFICGNTIIELKPNKLINTPNVMAKTQAAIEFCKNQNWEYKIYDCGINTELIKTAYKRGEIKFARKYEDKFLDYINSGRLS